MLLKIFDIFLPFSQNLLFDNIAILREVSGKSTKPRSLIFLPCIPNGAVSAMMLFKHDSFYMKIFIDD